MRSVERAGASTSTTLRLGGWTARVSPWRRDALTAHLVPADPVAPLPADLPAALDDLVPLGYRDVLTAALPPDTADHYLAAGFTPRQDLALLQIDLQTVDLPAGGPSVRRPHRAEWREIVEVDAAAFDHFWHLDVEGLNEARGATPSSRVRVTAPKVVGYAITGRAGRRGYVQRLAVHPDAAGRGWGSALLLDGLRWLQLRGAQDAVVNTQVSNERALVLYRRYGFVDVPGGLVVVGRRLVP
jgi:ribosomal protein S18 acetylase RimI-like enzyme